MILAPSNRISKQTRKGIRKRKKWMPMDSIETIGKTVGTTGGERGGKPVGIPVARPVRRRDRRFAT